MSRRPADEQNGFTLRWPARDPLAFLCLLAGSAADAHLRSEFFGTKFCANCHAARSRAETRLGI
jgi:hypothetical protein